MSFNFNDFFNEPITLLYKEVIRVKHTGLY